MWLAEVASSLIKAFELHINSCFNKKNGQLGDTLQMGTEKDYFVSMWAATKRVENNYILTYCRLQ